MRCSSGSIGTFDPRCPAACDADPLAWRIPQAHGAYRRPDRRAQTRPPEQGGKPIECWCGLHAGEWWAWRGFPLLRALGRGVLLVPREHLPAGPVTFVDGDGRHTTASRTRLRLSLRRGALQTRLNSLPAGLKTRRYVNPAVVLVRPVEFGIVRAPRCV